MSACFATFSLVTSWGFEMDEDEFFKGVAEKTIKHFMLRKAYVSKNLKKMKLSGCLKGKDRNGILALTRELQERFEALAKARKL